MTWCRWKMRRNMTPPSCSRRNWWAAISKTAGRKSPDPSRRSPALRWMPQKRKQQLGRLFRLLLLHPMAGAIDEMKADHVGAGAVPHALRGTGRLIGAPITFACDIHRRYIDGASGEGVHFGHAFWIGTAPHPVALQRAGKFGAAVFGHVHVNFSLGQPFAIRDFGC